MWSIHRVICGRFYAFWRGDALQADGKTEVDQSDIAASRISYWRATPTPIRAGSVDHNGVETSTSVSRKVTVPDGIAVTEGRMARSKSASAELVKSAHHFANHANGDQK